MTDDDRRHPRHVRGKSAPHGREQMFDRVLVSVGRRPNPAFRPGQDQGQVNERGFIEVDGQRRTAEPSIFAIGDVAGEPMLAHKATHEGRVAVEAISASRGLRAARHSGRGLHRSGDRLGGLTEAEAEEAERDGRGRASSRGPPRAAHRRSTAPTA